MMKAPLAALAASFVALLAADARAQTFVGAGGPTSLAPGTITPAQSYTPPLSPYAGFGGFGGAGSLPYTPPYSYYAAYPGIARGYVGYKDTNFAFYGQPYGHPYDKWSWPYLGGSSGYTLARYYYPPVP